MTCRKRPNGFLRVLTGEDEVAGCCTGLTWKTACDADADADADGGSKAWVNSNAAAETAAVDDRMIVYCSRSRELRDWLRSSRQVAVSMGDPRK